MIMKNKGGLEIFQQGVRKEVTETGRKGGASERSERRTPGGESLRDGVCGKQVSGVPGVPGAAAEAVGLQGWRREGEGWGEGTPPNSASLTLRTPRIPLRLQLRPGTPLCLRPTPDSGE